MSHDAVVFGHMHEDHSAELALAPTLPAPRCLVIASGGDLALSLVAAGLRVLAVDSNPAQVALVRLKMQLADEAGAAAVRELCFCGQVDRALRCIGPLVAWLLDWPALSPGAFRRA